MKQKKKMLLAMAALSAVAVGVGTTSTFAWYQANALTGRAEGASLNGTVSAADPHYSAEAVDLPVTITVERQTLKGTRASNLSLDLAHYFAANDAGLIDKMDFDGKTYKSSPSGGTEVSASAGLYTAKYLSTDANSIRYKKLPAATDLDNDATAYPRDPYAVYKVFAQVTWKAAADASAAGTHGPGNPGFDKDANEASVVLWIDNNGNKWTRKDAAEELEKTTDGQNNVYVTITRKSDASPASRAKFFGLHASTTPTPSDGKTGVDSVDDSHANLVQLDTALGDLYTPAATEPEVVAESYNKVQIATFGLYIEGETGSIDAKDSTPNGDFTVTVAAGHVS